MRPWLGICACAAACYSPRPSPGAPCTPAAPNCPSSQWCALVAGAYQCVEGAVEDAAAIDAAIDAPHDAPRPIDASIDAPPPPPWTLVQTQESMTSSISIAASGTGHLIVVGIETGTDGAVASVSDNAGNTYAQAPGARAVSTSASPTFGAELWFAGSSKAGATTITVSVPTIYAVVVWEVANISTTNPLDTDTKVDNQPASTTPRGAAITTSAPGELVIAVGIVDNTITGIHAGNEFTNDRVTNGNGWAHITSTSASAASHQAQWDQPSAGVSCAVSAAFRIGP